MVVEGGTKKRNFEGPIVSIRQVAKSGGDFQQRRRLEQEEGGRG